MVGSACFAVASGAGLASALLPAQISTINLIFFTGSIFFTLAAGLQLLEATNADRIAAITHRKPPEVAFRWFAWQPFNIGWLSAFTQFIGTVLFNFNTFDAFLPGLDWVRQDLLIWAPDLIGSACFLVASGLAVLECCHRYWCWQAADVSWWVVVINLFGSIAFGISAFYALVLPGTGDMLGAWAVNVWTCVGACCFLVGAYLLLPELARNLRRVIDERSGSAI
jgi:hypothetical protein